MAFVKKTWEDRLVEFPGRRRTKDVDTGEEHLIDVERAEGLTRKVGDAFSGINMNDLEQRIAAGFDNCPESAEVKKLSVVAALPQDAASHPDTLYIIWD